MKRGWKSLPFLEVVDECSKGNIKVPQGEYLESGSFAVVDQGKSLIGGYTEDRGALWQGTLPVIVFGDHTRCLKFVDFPFCMGADGVKVLSPREGIDTRYLYHFLCSLHIPSAGYSRHFKYLRSSDVDFPESHDEQLRIVDILDAAERIRENCLIAMERLDDLAHVIFEEMFGSSALETHQWPTVKLGDLLESATYGTSEKSGSEGAYPILRMGNITANGAIDLGDLKYIDLEEGNLDRYLVRAGDVLFNRTNSVDLVGKTAIYRGQSTLAYAGYLIRLRVNEENDPEYLSAFMNTRRTKALLRSMCKSIVGMANINAREVQEIKVPQPPLSLQRVFGTRIRRLEEIKKTHYQQLRELEALYASLQHRAFRGEL